MVWDAFEYITEFALKIDLFIHDIKDKKYCYFPNLNFHSEKHELKSTCEFIEWLKLLKTDFESRFHDFKSIQKLILFGKSLDKLDIKDIEQIGELLGIDVEKLKTQFITLKSRIMTNLQFDHSDFKSSCHDLPLIADILAKVISIFPSSYACESAFSKMNAILTEYRSRLTNDHLRDCLIIACSLKKPNIEEFVKNLKNCQLSH